MFEPGFQLSINWNGNTYFKSSCDFPAIEKDKDLIFICSSNSNIGTEEVLQKLLKHYKCGIPRFRCDEERKKIYLRIGGARFDSTTYEVVDECLKNKKLPAEEEMIDYGCMQSVGLNGFQNRAFHRSGLTRKDRCPPVTFGGIVKKRPDLYQGHVNRYPYVV